MNDFTPDSSQLKALETWYKPNSPLHLDPRHPCIKLAGEAGELLDLYGKHEYKPGFNWWDCKCGHPKDSHWGFDVLLCTCGCSGYTPLVLDELGDYSYYLRILCYQQKYSFELMCESFGRWGENMEMDLLLSWLSEESSKVLSRFIEWKFEPSLTSLKFITWIFLAILSKLDCPLEQLLDLNYQKLSTATMNGWKDAT